MSQLAPEPCSRLVFHTSPAVKAEESAAHLTRAAERGLVVEAARLKSCRSNPAFANVQGAAQVRRRTATPAGSKVHVLNGGRAGRGDELTIRGEKCGTKGSSSSKSLVAL